jgi:dUTP pyrophosphatase
MVHLGLGMIFDFPRGYAAYVRPRGSTIWSPKRGCRLEIADSNVPIDSGFRGEVKMVLVNHGPSTLELTRLCRFCQFVIEGAEFELVRVWSIEDLSPGDRGFGCNGSTGC